MSEIDKELLAAMEALVTTTPGGYFDELPAAIDARLEVEMAGTEMSQGDDDAKGDPVQGSGSTPSRQENTGLHDIRELARSQKQRISKRMSTQTDEEEALLASSASGLAAVVLPEPGKEKATYEESPARGKERTIAATAASASADRGGVPVWIYAVVGVAAAAAVAVFFAVRSSNRDGKEVAGNQTAPAQGGASDPGAPPPKAAGDSTVVPGGDDEKTQPDLAPTAVKTETGDDSAATPDTATITDKADSDTPAEPAAAAAKRPTKVAARPQSHERDRGRRDKDKRDTDKKVAAKADKPAAKKPEQKAEPAKKVGDAPKKPKSIDDLLSQAAGIKKGKPNDESGAEPAPKKPTKTKLSRGEIQAGMRSVLGRVGACYNTHRVSGTVMVRVTIAPNGKVASASATGKFAGTPTGNCVAAAVKRATFPAYDGKPTSFPYPFLLSP